MTPSPSTSVLIVTQETSLNDLFSIGLKSRGFDVTCVNEREDALRVIKETPFDAAIFDLMWDDSSPAFIETLKKASPETEVIAASGFSTLERSSDSTRNQGFDYIARPFSINHLSKILDRALEKKRLRNQISQLAEINRWKMELMWTLGHELRTPLTAVLGYTSLHMAGLYGPVNPDQEKNLQNVKRSADEILQLLNNILDLSKLTVERMPVHQDAFNLTELSKDILGSLGSLVHAKKLYLSLDAPTEVWVKTDRIRLRQVLVNLVGNAIKFTDQGGVTVRLRPEPAAHDVCIEVTDTGTGIRSEDVPKLFNEFTHLEHAQADKRGAGLGLSICKKIMSLLGGSVEVESTWGTGSTFRLALPAGMPAMRAIPPIQPAILN